MGYKEDKKDMKYKSYVIYLRFLCSVVVVNGLCSCVSERVVRFFERVLFDA